jgi:hypothetical protein
MPWINIIESVELTNSTKLGETFNSTILNDYLSLSRNLLEILVIVIAGVWALYKINEYREFKNWIQFDIDANIYPLSENIATKSYTWNEDGDVRESLETHTHAIEVLFKFNNKGKTRVKIYNIQAKISTLPPPDKALLDPEEGHLHLLTILRTGNIVPKKIKFYYIEPQVEQTITYLTLIKSPRNIIRIKGKFCQDQERIYPYKESLRRNFKHNLPKILCNIFEKRRRDPIYGWIFSFIYKNHCARLLSHTYERTYFIDPEGFIRK